MKVIAVIEADVQQTPLGTKSRLRDDLAGKNVLRQTAERLLAAERLAGVHVLCPAEQFDPCSALVSGTGAIVQRFTYEPPAWRRLVRSARKWSLDSWRGGIGGMTHFDEYTDPRVIATLLERVKADAVLSMPPAAVVIDPGLADQMIEHHHKTGPDVRLTFAPAPPGLSGVLLDTSLVRELACAGIPIGSLFSYKPDKPEKDLIFQPCCFDADVDVRHACGRLVADTDRAVLRLEALLGEHPQPDAATSARWLLQHDADPEEWLPREVEIELTTDDPFPDTLLRTRGSRVDRRGPIDPDLVGNIATELGRFDDSLLVLGGFGDPLRHPAFAHVLNRAATINRAATVRERFPPKRDSHDHNPIFGLAVRTTAVDLSDSIIELLIRHEVDVLNVLLDAWTPELYARLHDPIAAKEMNTNGPAPATATLSKADLTAVLARLDRLAEHMRQGRRVTPILVPEMTKARDNVHELDAFHDGWLRRTGAVTISGYSHCSGQCEDRAVTTTASAAREACRRIRSRCLVLADGRVVACDQDFNARYPVGHAADHSLAGIWQGEAFRRLREAHRCGRFDPTPICAACDQWHRP